MPDNIPIRDHQNDENLHEKVKDVSVDDAHKAEKLTKLGRNDMNPDAGSD